MPVLFSEFKWSRDEATVAELWEWRESLFRGAARFFEVGKGYDEARFLRRYDGEVIKEQDRRWPQTGWHPDPEFTFRSAIDWCDLMLMQRLGYPSLDVMYEATGKRPVSSYSRSKPC